MSDRVHKKSSSSSGSSSKHHRHSEDLDSPHEPQLARYTSNHDSASTPRHPQRDKHKADGRDSKSSGQLTSRRHSDKAGEQTHSIAKSPPARWRSSLPDEGEPTGKSTESSSPAMQTPSTAHIGELCWNLSFYEAAFDHAGSLVSRGTRQLQKAEQLELDVEDMTRIEQTNRLIGDFQLRRMNDIEETKRDIESILGTQVFTQSTASVQSFVETMAVLPVATEKEHFKLQTSLVKAAERDGFEGVVARLAAHHPTAGAPSKTWSAYIKQAKEQLHHNVARAAIETLNVLKRQAGEANLQALSDRLIRDQATDENKPELAKMSTKEHAVWAEKTAKDASSTRDHAQSIAAENPYIRAALEHMQGHADTGFGNGWNPLPVEAFQDMSIDSYDPSSAGTWRDTEMSDYHPTVGNPIPGDLIASQQYLDGQDRFRDFGAGGHQTWRGDQRGGGQYAGGAYCLPGSTDGMGDSSSTASQSQSTSQAEAESDSGSTSHAKGKRSEDERHGRDKTYHDDLRSSRPRIHRASADDTTTRKHEQSSRQRSRRGCRRG